MRQSNEMSVQDEDQNIGSVRPPNSLMMAPSRYGRDLMERGGERLININDSNNILTA